MIAPQDIISFSQQYGYVILYPLMVIEGPIVTLIAGSLAALGLVNVWLVYALSIAGDLTMDIILYSFGYFGKARINHYLTKHRRLQHKERKITGFFRQHGGKTIFLVKITTGLCYLTFITAGLTKMPFRKFLFFSLLGGVFWSGLLVSLGYFYGNMYQTISANLDEAGWVILLGGLMLITIFIFLRKKESEKIINKL